MDRLLNIFVRIMIGLSRFAPFFARFGLVKYVGADEAAADGRLHILLVGYNGARNTGSDVRVAEIARQLKERLGSEHVAICVMTLDEESLRCYFDEDVRLIQVSSIFLWDVFKACCENQAAILCEGSTLKSKFANALTLYSCEAAGIMKNQHKPCIAYGSEADEMDEFLARTIKKVCTDTYFIARTRDSLDRIRGLGLRGRLGTDTAWEFDSSGSADWAIRQLKAAGWDGEAPLLGVAPINPFRWPVRPSLLKWLRAGITGDHALQFRLWYFFSWSKSRRHQYAAYLDAIAAAVNDYAAAHPCRVVILGMEELDSDACKKLKERLNVPAMTILSANHNGYEMAAVLRQLSMLITSRYHAKVLSMEAGVPCVAVSMDERLDNLMQEMGMDHDQLLKADDSDLAAKLMAALTYVDTHQEEIRKRLGQQYAGYCKTFDEMGDFLIWWLRSRLDVVS